MRENLVTGYVTNYALTKGIIKVIGVVTDTGALAHPKGLWYFRNGTWFLIRQDALAHAENLRAAKINSLRTQISRLQFLEIGVVEEAR
jgi:hypothetical protein